ncbi:MAG: hypothetical protein FJX34_01460 [Alphaproteobacteria bacterium]|nr:hypothetical protein [Alphaproteobacteria bacterium]
MKNQPLLQQDTKLSYEVKLDYLGNPFVYDEFNQNPDLISVNDGGFKVIFTRDVDLINQYYMLRDVIYRFENGWEKYNGMEKEFDRLGKIIVTLNSNNEVIGGMRLMISSECKYLSNEIPGTIFTYKKILERYEKSNASEAKDKNSDFSIAEISAVVSSRNGRNSDIIKYMFFVVSEKFIGLVHYIFGVAQITLCRLYRIEWSRIGHYLEIVITYPWDKKQVYNYTPMLPIYVKLKNQIN